jgi:hypothetical protein
MGGRSEGKGRWAGGGVEGKRDRHVDGLCELSFPKSEGCMLAGVRGGGGGGGGGAVWVGARVLDQRYCAIFAPSLPPAPPARPSHPPAAEKVAASAPACSAIAAPQQQPSTPKRAAPRPFSASTACRRSQRGADGGGRRGLRASRRQGPAARRPGHPIRGSPCAPRKVCNAPRAMRPLQCHPHPPSRLVKVPLDGIVAARLGDPRHEVVLGLGRGGGG